jgi:hypothetical protein
MEMMRHRLSTSNHSSARCLALPFRLHPAPNGHFWLFYHSASNAYASLLMRWRQQLLATQATVGVICMMLSFRWVQLAQGL